MVKTLEMLTAAVTAIGNSSPGQAAGADEQTQVTNDDDDGDE